MSTLQESIEKLYAAFADVPKPQRIDACTHCVDDKEIATLLSKPVRDISVQELGPYAASAFLTVGDVPDYLYFLPRILEISATDDSWWPDPEITGRAIHSTSPSSWPTARLAALEDFLMAVIRDAIQSGLYHKLDPWLCAIGRMGLDVRPYLVQIASKPDAVIAYFEDNAQSRPLDRLSNAFWELPNKAHDDIVMWFKSDETRKILFEAYGYLP